MEDMLELAGEVQETLGRAYGLPDDVDEDDLEAGRWEIVSCAESAYTLVLALFSAYQLHLVAATE